MNRTLIQIVELARILPVSYPAAARRLRSARETLRYRREELQAAPPPDAGTNSNDRLDWILLDPAYRMALDTVTACGDRCDETWHEICLLRELVASQLGEIFPKLRFLPDCVLRPAWHDVEELDWSAVRRELRTVEAAARHALQVEVAHERSLPAGVAPSAATPQPKPVDLVRLTWLRQQVPPSKVKGDASKLAAWLIRRKVPIVKIAGKNYAQRSDLLGAFKAGSRVHKLIAEYDADSE